MAASFRGRPSPDSSKPISRSRHGHDRRRDSRSRRPKSEHHSPRCSPPRQMQWPLQQLPTPMTTPNSSALSLSAPAEHNRGITMERTPSGNSIMSDTPFEQRPDNTLNYRDEEAARRVEYHFSRLPSHSKHERILRKLIKRDDPLDEGTLDNRALEGILTAADSVFFDGVLSGRVQWEWSSLDRYRTELIGTTALRRCSDRDGFETLIVLSEPILTDPKYDRRLLLSAFLHELVHCYLFILGGFEARAQGGHTKGFHRISEIIDNWVGGGYLSLCNMKANLNHFRKNRDCAVPVQILDPRIEGWRSNWNGRHGHEGCNQSPRPEREYLDESGANGYGFLGL